MRFSTLFICALVCLFVVSIRADETQDAASTVSEPSQSNENNSQQDGEVSAPHSDDPELEAWYAEQLAQLQPQ